MYEFKVHMPERLLRFSVAGFLNEGEIRRFRADMTSHQGNRVRLSLSDEAGEELVIPCGDFAFEAHGILGR